MCVVPNKEKAASEIPETTLQLKNNNSSFLFTYILPSS